jgi:hypothetical protein
MMRDQDQRTPLAPLSLATSRMQRIVRDTGWLRSGSRPS